MTEPTKAWTNVFSLSGAIAYAVAIFFIAKELAKFPSHFLTKEGNTALDYNFLASLLEPKIKTSAIPLIGQVSISPLQWALFLPLLFILLVRFYYHAERLERRYTGEGALVEPAIQRFLRIVWVLTPLNIPNLISMFSSSGDAMFLVRWLLVSLLMMYVSIVYWDVMCKGQWIEITNHSRLKEKDNFYLILTVCDGLPIFVIVASLGVTFYDNSLQHAFIAMIASIGACFVAVSISIYVYLAGLSRLLFLTFLFIYFIGFLSQTTIGMSWLGSVMN